MSSASSVVTYTSVYTDSEPGRVFWGADEEISDGDLGIHGLGLVIVAIGKKLVVVLVGIVETVPTSLTR
ncbi:hypothetical protein Tco_1149086 [Tanacetum coccineum]